MSRRPMHVLRALVVIGVVAAIAGAATPAGHAKGISYHSLNKIQKRLISGSLAMSLTGATSTSQASDTETCGNGDNGGEEPDEAPSCPPDSYSPAPGPGGGATGGENYSPSGNNGCAENRGSNVKVNQNCLNLTDPDLQGRGQAQNEDVARGRSEQPEHIVASYNDYRRGDGNCGAVVLAQRRQELEPTRPPRTGSSAVLRRPRARVLAGGGDTSVAWDTKGNAYLSCQAFNRGSGTSPNPDQSSGFFVFRSTADQRRFVQLPRSPGAFRSTRRGHGDVLAR